MTSTDQIYSFVRKTYNTIANMQYGLIDKNEPMTFGLIQKLSENKKYNHHAIGEHLKNLLSLQRRLKRIESGKVFLAANYSKKLEDRRKNPYDPIAHPSLFFRRKEELQDLLSRSLSPKYDVSFSDFIGKRRVHLKKQ